MKLNCNIANLTSKTAGKLTESFKLQSTTSMGEDGRYLSLWYLLF